MDGKVSWAEHVNEVFGSYLEENELDHASDAEQEKVNNYVKDSFV